MVTDDKKNWMSQSIYSWKQLSIPINGTEALLLLSLDNHGQKKLLLRKQKSQLRQIIYLNEMKRAREEEIMFTKECLERIEESLPMFGTVDEGTYAPFRIKLSIAILALNSILWEEINNYVEEKQNETHNDRSTSKDNPDNNSKNIAGSETREKDAS